MSTDKSTFARKQDVDQLWKVVRALISAERKEHDAIRRRFEAIRVKVYKEKKKEWSRQEDIQLAEVQGSDLQPKSLQDRFQRWQQDRHRQNQQREV